MAKSSYGYQYDTSPRKYDEYSYSNSKKKKAKAAKNKTNKKQTIEKDRIKKQVNKKEKESLQNKENKKSQFQLTIKVIAFFLILIGILFRNTLVDEQFSKIQDLKYSITELQKENNQLEIDIQNSLNLNNIEQAAKELLGMQKLSNKQIVYINLSKKDYVEPRTEEIIMDNNQGFFSSLLEKIKNIF